MLKYTRIILSFELLVSYSAIEATYSIIDALYVTSWSLSDPLSWAFSKKNTLVMAADL